MNRYKHYQESAILGHLYVNSLDDETLLVIAQTERPYRPTSPVFHEHYRVVQKNYEMVTPVEDRKGLGFPNPKGFVGNACDALYERGVWDETDYDYWRRKVS